MPRSLENNENIDLNFINELIENPGVYLINQFAQLRVSISEYIKSFILPYKSRRDVLESAILSPLRTLGVSLFFSLIYAALFPLISIVALISTVVAGCAALAKNFSVADVALVFAKSSTIFILSAPIFSLISAITFIATPLLGLTNLITRSIATAVASCRRPSPAAPIVPMDQPDTDVDASVRIEGLIKSYVQPLPSNIAIAANDAFSADYYQEELQQLERPGIQLTGTFSSENRHEVEKLIRTILPEQKDRLGFFSVPASQFASGEEPIIPTPSH